MNFRSNFKTWVDRDGLLGTGYLNAKDGGILVKETETRCSCERGVCEYCMVLEVRNGGENIEEEKVGWLG